MHAKLVHVNRNFPYSLHGIGMKCNARFGGYSANFRDGLNGPQFVVCKHNSNQHGFRTHRAPDIVGIHAALAIDRQNCEGNAALREGPAGIQNRGVFNRGGDDMLVVARCSRHGAQNRVII